MTNPTILQRKDGIFCWLPEDRDTVLQALAGICEDMAGCSDEAIAAACRDYLRGQHKRFIAQTGKAYGLSLEETAEMVKETMRTRHRD
jgi:hypothetical protein